MDPNTVDLIEFPSVTIGDKSYPLSLTCATILRIKKSGIDVYSSPPYDPHAEKAIELTRKAMTTDEALTAEEREALMKEATAEWEQCSEARKAWEHPLECSDPVQLMENTFIVLAAIIGDGTTAEQLAERVEFGPEIVDIVGTVGRAIKKALSRIGAARLKATQEIQ